MYFCDALKALAGGGKIRRAMWEPHEMLLLDQRGNILFSMIAGQPAPWLSNVHDLTATDWQIYEPRQGEPS